MLNHVTIMGRITHDLELRTTQSGVPNITFTIACDSDYKPKDGGDRDVDFIRIKAWRNGAEFVNKFFGKGRPIIISGRLKADNYTDKDGNKRTDTYIQADNIYFADNKRDNDTSSSVPSSTASTAQVRTMDAILSEMDAGDGTTLPF